MSHKAASLFSHSALACALLFAGHLHLCFAAKVSGLNPPHGIQSVLSPDVCLGEIDESVSRAYREAMRAGRDVDSDKLKAQAEAIARRCASSFSLSAVPVAKLPTIARLYIESHQYSQADKAISRYLGSALIGRGEKAEALSRVIISSLYSYSLYDAADAERALHAETYLKKLEVLGPAFVRRQFDAHAQLAKHYLSAGKRMAALKHQAEVARLSERLKQDERMGALTDVLIGLFMLADFKCNKEGPDRARAFLKDISPELIRLTGTEQSLAAVRSRYDLAGRPAPELRPLYVLNDAGGAVTAHTRGRVTVLLFAAHWCGPCQGTYPYAAEIYEKFRGDGVRVLLVTRLYGYFGEKKGLKPEEELSALRDYYIGEMKLPFSVLVEAAPPEGEGTRGAAERDGTLFGTLPMMLVIDESGRTRAVLIGGIFDQRERLRAKVEELLKESNQGGRT